MHFKIASKTYDECCLQYCHRYCDHWLHEEFILSDSLFVLIRHWMPRMTGLWMPKAWEEWDSLRIQRRARDCLISSWGCFAQKPSPVHVWGECPWTQARRERRAVSVWSPCRRIWWRTSVPFPTRFSSLSVSAESGSLKSLRNMIASRMPDLFAGSDHEDEEADLVRVSTHISRVFQSGNGYVSFVQRGKTAPEMKTMWRH